MDVSKPKSHDVNMMIDTVSPDCGEDVPEPLPLLAEEYVTDFERVQMEEEKTFLFKFCQTMCSASFLMSGLSMALTRSTMTFVSGSFGMLTAPIVVWRQIILKSGASELP